ncbi:hypothetical protein [Streptosporangium sp. NPDC050280]|uniref:hypothetical protein n=1 Tax=unclassified Streptosporangium TaxID=2632669 RepID=UPI00344744CF
MREPAGERSAALREARWALARLESPSGRAPFSADLTPPHGVFYRGWTNWLRGGTLALLPHRADPGTGAPAEVARGSSQSLGQRFLVEIDPAFAAEQYRRFRDLYVVSPLGLGPAVREYPVGMDGPGDVDSGPLPLGVSLSATAVALGTAQIHGDAPLAEALANYGELAGLPIDTPWTKRYAFGLLPIGDAFLAWAKTARPWVAPPPSPPPATISPWWRTPLLALLLVIGLAPWTPALVRRRRSRRARLVPAEVTGEA